MPVAASQPTTASRALINLGDAEPDAGGDGPQRGVLPGEPTIGRVEDRALAVVAGRGPHGAEDLAGDEGTEHAAQGRDDLPGGLTAEGVGHLPQVHGAERTRRAQEAPERADGTAPRWLWPEELEPLCEPEPLWPWRGVGRGRAGARARQLALGGGPSEEMR